MHLYLECVQGYFQTQSDVFLMQQHKHNSHKYTAANLKQLFTQNNEKCRGCSGRGYTCRLAEIHCITLIAAVSIDDLIIHNVMHTMHIS